MAAKRRRRRRRRVNPWIIVLAIVIVLAAAIFITIKIAENAPSTKITDLEYYYNLKINAMTGRDAATAKEMAIVIDGEILDERAYTEDDGHVYINRNIVLDKVDERFYFDDTEQRVIFANALQVIETGPELSYYTVDGQQVGTDYAPVIIKNGEVFLAVDFVDEFSGASFKAYQEPARLVISTNKGTAQFVDTTEKTWLRVLEEDISVTKKSEVVGTVDKGSKLMIVGEQVGDWAKVVSEEGWVGYVDTHALTEPYTVTREGDITEPEYTSLNTGKTVKLGWAGIYSMAGNDNYYAYTRDTAINVYSPTWYFLSDGDGGITMLSDEDFVRSAHEDGYLVWALFSDEDYEFAEQALTRTTVRTKMIETLVGDMLSKGIDGINVDFERIDNEYGEDFIQFLRELSIRCRKEGLYLSVDNYAPYDFNACYHIEEQGRLCDYVVIMIYDDYLGSGEIGPNSSLPFVKEVMELSTSKVAPEKIVAALPFYSRIWYTEENGDLSRTEYSMHDIWDLFNQIDISPEWDEELGVYHASYAYGSKQANAWAEDEDTIERKLSLVKQFNPAGVAFWQLGQENEQTWEKVAAY